MWQDLVFALRQMRRGWRFYFLAATTLALGIGATTAIFSLISGVLLRSLPFPEQERLVALRTVAFSAGLNTNGSLAESSLENSSYPDFYDWRRQNRTLESMAAYTHRTRRKFTPAGNGKPRIIEGLHVSADFFRVLGVAPQLGRSFAAEDEKPGTCSIIISQEFWVSEFGAGLQGVGGPIRISDKVCTLVGVMPAGFSFPYRSEKPTFWATLAVLRDLSSDLTGPRSDRALNVVARLRPGVSPVQAKSELNTIQQGLAQTFAEDRNHSGVAVTPLLDEMTGGFRKSLLLLFGAVSGVLLIACVNVAGLLLARGVARKNEFGVRISLGASATRIIQQVLLESVLLSVLASIAGVALAFFLLKAFVGIVPTDLPRLHEVHVDGMVLAFTLLVSIVVGIGFGIFPAWSAARANGLLVVGRGRASSSGRSEQRLHGVLVVAEIALSLVLVASSGLLIRSFVETVRVNPGFDTHNLLTLRLGMVVVGYGGGEKAPLFMQRVNSAVAQIPGVESVTGGFPLPFTYDSTDSFEIQGQPTDLSDPLVAKTAIIQPGYFETLKVPLLRGRTFEERDNERAKRVAIVDAAFARQFFPNDEPIGKFIRPNVEVNEKPMWYEIVGVVGSMRTTDLTAVPESQFFLPFLQTNNQPQILILRTSGDAKGYEKSVTSAIQALDVETTIFDVSTMDERVSRSVVSARFEAQLLTAFGAIALLLAAVGLYAALSEMVARRRFEIGLRVALGAQTRDVLQLVLRRGLSLTMAGVASGLAGFAVAARLFDDMIYGISVFDPWTMGGAGGVLVVVAFVASAWPAWIAARLEPTAALREQ